MESTHTLYVLTRDNEYVLPLLAFGKGWHCDHTEVIDRTRTGKLLGRHPAPPPMWSTGGTEKEQLSLLFVDASNQALAMVSEIV